MVSIVIHNMVMFEFLHNFEFFEKGFLIIVSVIFKVLSSTNLSIDFHIFYKTKCTFSYFFPRNVTFDIKCWLCLPVEEIIMRFVVLIRGNDGVLHKNTAETLQGNSSWLLYPFQHTSLISQAVMNLIVMHTCTPSVFYYNLSI